MHLSTRQISVLLTIVALVLWSYSIIQAKLNIGFYGLINSFPITFFVALGILTIASAILWVSKESHGKLLLVQLCVLVVSLWLIPIVIGGFEPNNQDVFVLLSEPTGFIVKYGHIEPGNVWYHEWPAYGLFSAAGILISGKTIPMMGVHLSAFFLQIALLPFWYCVLRTIISEDKRNFVWAALWIFYLGSWTGESRYAPQYVAVCLILVLLVLLIRSTTTINAINVFCRRIVSILLIACLVITHGITSFASLLTITMLRLTRRISSWQLIMIIVLFLGGWIMFACNSLMTANFSKFLEQFFDIGSIYSMSVGERISGNEAHVAVNQLRIALSTIYFIMAGLGIALSWRDKRKHPVDTAMLVIMGSFFLLLPLFLYSGQLLIRVFLLVLIPLSYFAVKLLQLRGGVIIISALLLVALPLHFIAHYGNQQIDHISNQELAGAEFVDNYAQDFYLTGNLVLTGTEYPSSLLKSAWALKLPYEEMVLRNGELTRAAGMSKDRPYLITVGQYARDRFDYTHNDPYLIPDIEKTLNITTNCNLIFANTDLSLYINEVKEQ